MDPDGLGPDTAEDLIERLGLERHPEGGWFVETWRGSPGLDGRAIGTSILFLLRGHERSHWHRVDATEIWHHHAGAPLELRVVGERGVVAHTVGDAAVGFAPSAIVPPHAWQSAASTGAWSLVACTVTPGFDFDGFELAPPDWSPTTD